MHALQDLKETVAQLRAPGGCPWDLEQTHQSVCQCLVEEVCELLDTIDRLDMPHMCEELGDVLLQVFFHAQMAEESGFFAIEDVAKGVTEKLIRRHPHVFGSAPAVNTSAAVLAQWEQLKQKEAPRSGIQKLKAKPKMLPALLFAEAFLKQFPQTVKADGIPFEKEEEVALALLDVVSRAKASGINAESALRRYVNQQMAQHSN